jgi:hypothetical protein
MNNLTAAAGIANIATFTIIGYHMIALTIDDYISALELVSIEWDNSITGIFSQYTNVNRTCIIFPFKEIAVVRTNTDNCLNSKASSPFPTFPFLFPITAI